MMQIPCRGGLGILPKRHARCNPAAVILHRSKQRHSRPSAAHKDHPHTNSSHPYHLPPAHPAELLTQSRVEEAAKNPNSSLSTHPAELVVEYLAQEVDTAPWMPAHTASRSALVRVLLACASAAGTQFLDPVHSAQASKLVELRDGTSIEAYEHGLSLAIVALRGSVPAQWVIDFRLVLGKYAGFTLDQRGQFEDIFKELSESPASSKRSSAAADVVSIGDTWLSPSIRQGLIQPIKNAHTYRWYQELPSRWRALVHRDREGRADFKGEVYAAPFRWGATLIGYRKDRLLSAGGHAVTDWSDLLQPKLKGKVAFLDSSRELVGAALKSLGCSYNTTAAAVRTGHAGITEEQLKERVTQFREQALIFSNRDHVRAITAGDAWAVVGSSADVVQVSERINSVQSLLPLSGTALWADLWVVPTGARGGHQQKGPSPILPAWLEFGLQPERAIGLPGLKTGASPLLLPPAVKQHSKTHSGGASRGVAETATKGPHLSGAHVHVSGQPHIDLLASGIPSVHGGAERDREVSPALSLGALTGLLEKLVKGGDGDGAARELEESLRLTYANAYLPRQDVLAASEFLLPLSADTLAMYKRVLGP